MKVVLALTYHDPHGRLLPAIERYLPQLADLFAGIALYASPQAHAASLAAFAAHGVVVRQEAAREGPPQLGHIRRWVVTLALEQNPDFVLYSDGDRMLYWVEHFPGELAGVVTAVQGYDYTVIGRSPRAFASHPRVQRETEAIANHVFALVSGHEWDITSGARALSRRAAEVVVAQCREGTVGVDATWPLLIQRQPGMRLGYLPVEGMAFETAAQFAPEVAANGGEAAWKATLDADPARWLRRLGMAADIVAGMESLRQ